MDRINRHIGLISNDLGIKTKQVEAVCKLLSDGATVPFIARYRKEVTGSLDEVAIQTIRDWNQAYQELDKRFNAMCKSLKERELLTDELRMQLDQAETMTALEDAYLPYKQKKRTRATIAREKGLEPLAQQIYAQKTDYINLKNFINPSKDVSTEDDALSGALDIIAEWVSENPEVRSMLREQFRIHAILESKVIAKKRDEAQKYRDYFDWSEPLKRAPGHRIHAILRGQNEGFLRIHALPDTEKACHNISRIVTKGRSYASSLVFKAVEDAYKRLIAPSMENEILKEAKLTADVAAISVFTSNLRELLLAAPLGRKPILAIDPGLRTGSKVVVLDRTGNFINHYLIFTEAGEGKRKEAAALITKLTTQYKVEAIAVGNGTGGRETEAFIRSLNLDCPVIQVNESGASIYSASECARVEFPNLDLTVRGAISIGRRLQDPLAELVKLDPKTIGVGQYQHDVDQASLRQGLDDTVMSCVNAVGVDLNSASAQLLSYVSGIGPQIAGNIVGMRKEIGTFTARSQLKKVPRLGPKAFEQAAGFMRISNGKNPLDNSAVHPERYELVKRMAGDVGCSVSELLTDPGKRSTIRLENYVSEDVGLPTLKDIIKELDKPGRDPRPDFEVFSFSEDVHTINDLIAEMELDGIVTNVTKFGAFVDVGVHQDGLIHISKLSDGYVSDPNEVIKVNQKVKVKVLEVDTSRRRISLERLDR